MRGVRRWSVVLALACFGNALPLQANQLKVGISGSAPFVIKNGDQLSGISLNIWRRVAEDNNLSYELVEQPSPKAGIEAVDDGEIDVLVGPISITSRRLAMPGIDFTQPYYLGKSGVLLPMRPPSILSRVQVFFGWAVISSVLVLISVLLVVGSLIWLAERNRNSEQFPREWLPGISSGMWFALVTFDHGGLRRQSTDHTNRPKHHRRLDGDLPDRGVVPHRQPCLGVHPVPLRCHRIGHQRS